jgi:protein O-GlcNAc transferase
MAMSNKDTLLHAAALLNAGHWREAERICLQTLNGQRRDYGQQRDYAEVMHDLGILSGQYGELTLGMGFIQKAIDRSPGNARYYADLGDLLARQNRFKEAIAIFDQALGIKPDFAQAHFLRGRALLASGHLDAAAAAYEQALAIEPDLADAHFGLGVVFQIRGHADKAVTRYDRALRINPHFAKAHNNRGTIVMQRGLSWDALESFDKAIHIQSDFVEAYNNRGNAFLGLGRFDRAAADFRKAVQLRPDYSQAWSNMLFGLNYDPGIDQKQLAGEHRAWAARFGRVPAPTNKPHKNLPDPHRPLRLGYVSADFGHHPVGFFSLPVLAAHDREQFSVYCYSNRPVCNEDHLTARFKTHASVWRCTAGVADIALAEQIRADGIDILVDLSGHTAGNRLTMFALKPAPVQVHWAGYCHTTALPAIDYALWDAIQVPAAGEERWFTETIVRLPDARWCYAPPDYAPEVAEPPVLKRGYTTFGSFNNLTKLNKAVI